MQFEHVHVQLSVEVQLNIFLNVYCHWHIVSVSAPTHKVHIGRNAEFCALNANLLGQQIMQHTTRQKTLRVCNPDLR